MSSSPSSSTNSTSTPTDTPPDNGVGRGSRFGDGLRSIFKAFWFLISLVIYVLGSILYQAGRALITISGWGPHEADGDADPPAPTANV